MRRKLGGRGPYLDYENSVKGASVGMLICTYSLNQLAGQFVSQLSVSVVNHAWETCVVGLLSEAKSLGAKLISVVLEAWQSHEILPEA